MAIGDNSNRPFHGGVYVDPALTVSGVIDQEADDQLADDQLALDQEAWFQPGKGALGPAARAFHAAAVIGRRRPVDLKAIAAAQPKAFAATSSGSARRL